MLIEEIPGSAAVSIDGSQRYDLPRNSQHVALIGDPRNDENLIVSQLHLAFLRFHNAVVADVKADLGPGITADEIFAEAQRVVRWHYQWIVLHEFLPHTVGAAIDRRRADATARSSTPGATTRSSRSSSPSPPTGSATRRCGRATGPTSAPAPTDPAQQFFALIFDPTPPTPTTRPTCAAAGARRAGSSTGRPSSTSATAGCAPTRRSTPRCPRVAVPPARPGPGHADVAGHPQPAAQPDHGGAVRPAGRHARCRLPELAPGDLADLTPFSPRQAHPAVVLRPARGEVEPQASTSDRSAAGSSPRSRSGSSRATASPTCAGPGGRRPTACTFEIDEHLLTTADLRGTRLEAGS